MSNATVPLQPWQVSSFGYDGMETQINFADLTNCSTKPSSVITDPVGPYVDGGYDFCHPSIQYDISYLSTIQPEWVTCVNVGGVLYDPPRALTSASALNGPDPQATFSKAASPSLTLSATPGAHLAQAPPMTDPPIGPSMPKQTQIDPAGRVSPTKTLQETPSDPNIQSSAGLSDAIDPKAKPEDAAAAGQGPNGPAGDPEDANTDKLQIGTSVHPFTKPTPTAAGTVFTIGPQGFTLNPQGVTVDGIEIKVGGTPVTVDGTRFSLGPSEFIVGAKTETFAPPSTRDPLVEVDGVKGGVVGQGLAAGSERNGTTSAGADAGIGGALMSGLGAVGGGAATHGAGPGSGGNVVSAAPFLGTAASKTRGGGDGVDLWVRVGWGLFVSVCLVIVTD